MRLLRETRAARLAFTNPYRMWVVGLLTELAVFIGFLGLLALISWISAIVR